MAWLINWNYRKAVTISNTGSSLTDYQVQVTIDTASLVTAGKLLSSCNDIRFTASDGSTVLNYWIESGCNTASTKIWVKIPSIAAGSNTIYFYYNNTGASAVSNGLNTFNFFEDFAGNTYAETGWTNTDATKFSLTSDQLQVTNFYNNRSNQAYNNNSRVAAIGQNFELQFDAIGTLGTYNPIAMVGLRSSSVLANSGPATLATIWGGSTSGQIYLNYTSSSQALSAGTFVLAKSSGVNSNRFYYTLRSYVSGGTSNDSINIYSNSARTTNVGSATNTHTPFTPSVFDCPNYVHYDPANNNYYTSFYVDNIRIRKYVSPDPTFSSLGTEETQTCGTPSANLIVLETLLDQLSKPYPSYIDIEIISKLLDEFI